MTEGSEENSGDFDVLLGRGSGVVNMPGNRNFRTIIVSQRERYKNAERAEKQQIAKRIVQTILDSGGRFLRFDKTKDEWVGVEYSKAVEKASQALREKFKAPGSETTTPPPLQSILKNTSKSVGIGSSNSSSSSSSKRVVVVQKSHNSSKTPKKRSKLSSGSGSVKKSSKIYPLPHHDHFMSSIPFSTLFINRRPPPSYDVSAIPKHRLMVPSIYENRDGNAGASTTCSPPTTGRKKASMTTPSPSAVARVAATPSHTTLGTKVRSVKKKRPIVVTEKDSALHDLDEMRQILQMQTFNSTWERKRQLESPQRNFAAHGASSSVPNSPELKVVHPVTPPSPARGKGDETNSPGLQQAGFSPTLEAPPPGEWYVMYQLLLEFYRTFGHYAVSPYYAEHKELADWIACQRQMYREIVHLHRKATQLEHERLWKLQQIHFPLDESYFDQFQLSQQHQVQQMMDCSSPKKPPSSFGTIVLQDPRLPAPSDEEPEEEEQQAMGEEDFLLV